MLPSELMRTDLTRQSEAEMMLERARWAAARFARFDRARTLEVAHAVAEAGAARARHYAEWAVRETGFGVVEHKELKNRLTSTGLYEHYRERDFVGKRIDAERKLVEIPRPAGVVFALAPSTNPISTVYFKALCALLTRNAVVISPHPAARECSVDAIDYLAEAATRAGAPDGAIQAVREPNLALIDAIMRSPLVDVILATGGTPMVRAAYRSGNPAIGVGPGNAPVLVDASADPEAAAARIIESKSFDNSILCTNESVLVVEAAAERRLLAALKRNGAHLCSAAERDRLREYLFGEAGFNVEALGKSASWIAAKIGARVAPSTRVLLAPIERYGSDEPLSREKLCPVLGYYRAESVERGIAVSAALLRMLGAGHSAAIHSNEPRNIMAFAAAVRALRVVVNSPCSQGAAGFGTGLAPSFTIGTGFFGRSSVGENIGPEHLVNWTRIAYNEDPAEVFRDLGDLEPWEVAGKARPAPAVVGAVPAAPATALPESEIRDRIRRIVLEELRQILGE